MKKTTTPAKLKLNRETLKTLKTATLEQVAGGVTGACTMPTTTVQHTFDC
jgi:dihydroorotase-like cyclic amidohydrolase